MGLSDWRSSKCSHIKLDGINTQRVELGYWYEHGSVLVVDENGYALKSI